MSGEPEYCNCGEPSSGHVSEIAPNRDLLIPDRNYPQGKHPPLTDAYLRSLGIGTLGRWHILEAVKQGAVIPSVSHPPDYCIYHKLDDPWCPQDDRYPPTTTHPQNPCAETLIKALTQTIHKLKAYKDKETANQPVDKAELTAILAFIREHLKTIGTKGTQ